MATDLILGTGLDVMALRTLSARARAARTAAGITTPLRIWGFVTTYVAPDKATADAARISQRGRSVGTARFSFSSTFEDKGVPEAWQPILRERLARYDFTNHGVGAGNTNGHLFDDHPDLQEYLVNRFQLLGTADECEARLRQVAADAGLDGCWFTQSPLTPDEDPIQRVRTTGEALAVAGRLRAGPSRARNGGVMTARDSGRPLDGVRVLDFGQYVAGPMAATLLADAGAEVTRIEPPGGPRFTDPGNAYLLRGRAATHVLDLKSRRAGRGARAGGQADVLIENFRPGVMARLGLDAATCQDLNRGLVYCSLPGFSELDERAGLAGWEGVVMAAGGAYSRQASSPIFGGATGEMPDFPSLPLASCFTAGMTALSACAALIARERDGGLGQRIEIPLSDALLEGSGILTTRVEKQAPCGAASSRRGSTGPATTR